MFQESHFFRWLFYFIISFENNLANYTHYNQNATIRHQSGIAQDFMLFILLKKIHTFLSLFSHFLVKNYPFYTICKK